MRDWAIATTNIVVWPVLQLGVARLFVLMPRRWFDREPARERRHRRELYFYQRVLHIKRWKNLLPDGGTWVGGTSKKRLTSHDREYLLDFVLEARRGERTHWAAIACSPVFFLWNPRYAWWIAIAVALVINLPCAIVQRYNRFVLVDRLR